MLGNILGALTDAASAEEALAAIGDPDVVERVRRGAAAEGVGVGAFVASTVRQMLDYAEEDVWLDLLGRMSDSPRRASPPWRPFWPAPFQGGPPPASPDVGHKRDHSDIRLPGGRRSRSKL